MELAFDRSQSIEAAIECSSVHAAITYLQQECQLCAEKFTMKQVSKVLWTSMYPYNTHKIRSTIYISMILIRTLGPTYFRNVYRI